MNPWWMKYWINPVMARVCEIIILWKNYWNNIGLYWNRHKKSRVPVEENPRIIGSDPEIGNVYFNEIGVGIGNVYFYWEIFILVRHGRWKTHRYKKDCYAIFNLLFRTEIAIFCYYLMVISKRWCCIDKISTNLLVAR